MCSVQNALVSTKKKKSILYSMPNIALVSRKALPLLLSVFLNIYIIQRLLPQQLAFGKQFHTMTALYTAASSQAFMHFPHM